MASSRTIVKSTWAVRFLTFMLSTATVVVLATDTIKFSDGSKTIFSDVLAYRYVISTAAIGAVYSLLQIPFGMYYCRAEKRMIRGRFLPEFDFYADKIVSGLLATGVGAGFAVTFELFDDDLKSFMDKAYITSGLLLGAYLCMLVLSIFSSINRRTGFFS